MRLELEGRTIDNPGRADIDAAAPRGAAPEDFWIALERDNGDSLEAYSDGAGYLLTSVEGDELYEGVAPATGEQLRALLTAYLDGDERWRGLFVWRLHQAASQPQTTAPPAPGRGDPPAWAPFAIAAVIVPLFVAFLAGYSPLDLIPLPAWPFPPPFDSTLAKIVIGFIGVVALIILAAATAKAVEVRRASRWPKAMGRITQSEQGVETRGDDSGSPTHRAVARIAYEFEVAGRKQRGARVSFSEITPESEVAGILARYPKGKLVEVYYDPRDPSRSVLERDAPRGIALAILALVGLLLALGGLVLWSAWRGPETLKAWLPNATPLVFVPAALGAFILLGVFLSMWRRTRAAQSWPTTTGEIVLSDIMTITSHKRRAHAPLVEYAYSVGGRAWRSRQIRLGVDSSGSKNHAAKIAAKYPKGALVKVRYNPDNPMEAALDTRMGLIWLLAVFGGACAVAAIMASGLMS